MPRPKVSIAELMAVTALVALTAAVWRPVHSKLRPAGVAASFGPIGAGVLIASWRLARGRPGLRPFCGGFLVAGSVAAASLVVWFNGTGSPRTPATDWLWGSYLDWLNSHSPAIPENDGLALAAAGIYVSLPQVLVATVGGAVALFAWRRLRPMGRVGPTETDGAHPAAALE